MNQSLGRRFRMRLNHNRRLGRFGVKALDVSAHCSPVHIALRNNDTVTAGDADKDTLLVGIDRLGLIFWWLADIKANLLDEGGGHDEKYEHDEHHVEHGGQIDLLFVFLLPTAAEWSAHLIPLEPLDDKRVLY